MGMFLYGCIPEIIAPPHDIYIGSGLYLERSMYDSDRHAEIMDAAMNGGISWSREEFHWDMIAPERGKYDESVLFLYDRTVEGLSNRGINILGLLAYTTPWSSGETAPDTPEERKDYAAFAAAMAFRYRGQVDHWEIWNEPNIERFWKPEPDPEAYAALYVEAAQAIHEVNPEATIFCCSTSGTDYMYIRRVIETAGADMIEGVSFHPYSGDTPWDRSDEVKDTRRLLDILDFYGLDVPLWVTEIGYPTSQTGNGVDEITQAALLVRAYLSLYAVGVENVFSYDFVDDGTAPDDNELHFGMLRHNLSPKLSWYAIQVMGALLTESRFEARVDEGDIVRLRFERADGTRVWVVWDGRIGVENRTMEPARNKQTTLPMEGSLEAFSLYGKPVDITSQGSRWMVNVSGEPCYLIQSF